MPTEEDFDYAKDVDDDWTDWDLYDDFDEVDADDIEDDLIGLP